MNVLILSPGYPVELGHFTTALGRVGASVFGVGEQPASSFPEPVRDAMTAYVQIPSLFDEDAAIADILRETQGRGLKIDRVETLWEPLVILAARLRERLGAQGLSVERAIPFRDKETMKTLLDAHGIRTPHHYRCLSSDECRSAGEKIGFPLIVKPISGAGSADTYRCDNEEDFERAIAMVGHVAEVSVEEYIDGEEFTFDTICANGEPQYYSICWYRPRPLLQKQLEWISPMAIQLKDPDVPHLRDGVEMGFQVLKALRFESGFTHMEWFLTERGEAVFGEIGARVPGARTADLMNFASDYDVYRAWAEAICFGRIGRRVERRYNAASVFKRARGHGRIQRIDGLQPFLSKYSAFTPVVDLLPVGAPRRDWKQTLISDGIIVVRHPDFQTLVEMTDKVANEITMYMQGD